MCQTKAKKVIIGIYGGTFNIIDPLVESGRLHNFRKSYELRFRILLRSTVPPATVPAWPSFYTGKNPAKYGVFDFLKIDEDGKLHFQAHRVKGKKRLFSEGL